MSFVLAVIAQVYGKPGATIPAWVAALVGGIGLYYYKETGRSEMMEIAFAAFTAFLVAALPLSVGVTKVVDTIRNARRPGGKFPKVTWNIARAGGRRTGRSARIRVQPARADRRGDPRARGLELATRHRR